MADYRVERDAIIGRWYGSSHRPLRRKSTSWPNPIGSRDYVGVPTPTNAPFAHSLMGDCLVWVRALNTEGYGTLTIKGKRFLAHRVAYRQGGGEIPSGQQINHLCNRPYCVQPAHLYAGTQQDNADDARLFKSDSMFSPVDRILLAPDAEHDDPLVQRLQSSRRFEFVEPWESPTQPTQTSLDEFECPGHVFQIPAGEGAVCRICERFESAEEHSMGYHIAVIGKEIYPVSQLIDSILNKVVTLELSQDAWKDWREKCCYRAGILVMGDDHVLRNCGCHCCVSDRSVFREKLAPTLTETETTILEICDWVEPVIRQNISEMRRDTFSEVFPLVNSDFTEEQKRDLIDHLDECTNTLREVRSAAHQIERLLGYYIHAVVTYDSLDEFDAHDTYFRYCELTRRFRLPDQPEVKELCASNAMKIGEEIFGLVDEKVDGVSHLRECMPPAEAEKVRYFTQFLIATELCDVITHDLYGRTRNSDVFPLPHQSCVEQIIRPQPDLIEIGQWNRINRAQCFTINPSQP